MTESDVPMNPTAALQEFHPDRPYWLYRYFDEQWRLLYIGIARDVDRRLTEHGYAYWRPYVRYVKATESFPTRSEARGAEREAIRAEQPLFNGTHVTAATALRALEYVEAKGDDAIPCQRRLLRIVMGTGYIRASELAGLVEAYRRDGSRRGVIRVA